VLRVKPVRDRAYLAWLRLQTCIVAQFSGELLRTDCGGQYCEAAHMGDRGLRQKASDHDAVPLCANHHRIRPDAHHRLGKTFAAYFALDIPAIQAALRKQYLAERPETVPAKTKRRVFKGESYTPRELAILGEDPSL
jgi:hypothetical protein